MSNGIETSLSTKMIYRDQYAQPAFWIDSVHLTFDLDPQKTRVLNKMMVRRNPNLAQQPLKLDGEDLNLSRIMVNGQGISFKMEGNTLVLANLPENNDPFELEIFTTCFPSKNTTLSGLYVSQDAFFTQCEAQGFRRITYFLDRPDVMARYTVLLRANKKDYPVLLSNGNLLEEGDLEEGRHYALWEDPFCKPSYLFALVAGQFVAREQRIKSRSGNPHLLQVYVRQHDLDKTEFAMKSLMASIAWDEAKYGLSLDLERFMIVATSDFNMGAMENKGLNIFNSKFVLANPAVATDADYQNVEGVIGHEYFHNWTGNRVTCRDWFQLSLKEGLTVFRDQEFSKDMCETASARSVIRIDEVRNLRQAQFKEDSGPMAHPVRPDSYSEINNFYTSTIYEKGAEVIRMMSLLVGKDGFANGMKLYFERFDGQAVTCDDFAKAIADANPQSPLFEHLEAFKHWYSQAGTPLVKIEDNYNADEKTYTLHFKQSCPDTVGQSNKLPFLIPIELGLIDEEGKQPLLNSTIQLLTKAEESITFSNIDKRPIPSLLRGFSAPVIVDYAYSQAQLITLLEHDTDPFFQWEAAQTLALQIMLPCIQAADEDLPLNASLAYIQALRTILRHPTLDAGFKDAVLTLPSESYIAEQLHSIDPQKIHAVRQKLSTLISCELEQDWVWAYDTYKSIKSAYTTDNRSMGRRALCAKALHHLCVSSALKGDPIWPGKTYRQFQDANNMTDRINALSALVQSQSELAHKALAVMRDKFAIDDLVIDKWFSLQAIQHDVNGSVLPIVTALTARSDFIYKNPNRARSLLFAYTANAAAFHRADGAGYAFWSKWTLTLDAINPQVAARFARGMDSWYKLSTPYREKALAAIKTVSTFEKLSNDTREIISRSLAMQEKLEG